MPIKAFASVLATALLAGIAGQAGAQQVYRIVGPDGKVTFSDRAPTADTPAQTVSAASAAAPTGPNLAGLPLEVRQAAGKYPVTLYTGKNCSACENARNYLQSRGVPFAEKTVTSNDEIKALQKLNSDGTIPFATLGGQHLSGFSENDWSSYLDAAGYPAKSQLPASYRQAAAVPMIPKAVKPAAAAQPQPAAASEAPSEPLAPQRVTPDNPTGIVF